MKNVIVIHLKKSDMEKASIKNFINQRKGNKMNEKEFEELDKYLNSGWKRGIKYDR